MVVVVVVVVVVCVCVCMCVLTQRLNPGQTDKSQKKKLGEVALGGGSNLDGVQPMDTHAGETISAQAADQHSEGGGGGSEKTVHPVKHAHRRQNIFTPCTQPCSGYSLHKMSRLHEVPPSCNRALVTVDASASREKSDTRS